jgi:hypothetical protein
MSIVKTTKRNLYFLTFQGIGEVLVFLDFFDLFLSPSLVKLLSASDFPFIASLMAQPFGR